MFLSSFSIVSPSLWFISALGLAQVNSPVKAPPNISPKAATQTSTPLGQLKKPDPECEDGQGRFNDATCVVKKVQSIYQSASSMTATFKQEYTYAVYQRTQLSTGQLFLKKPGRMRWDYKTPQSKVFVSNGDVLWVYEPEKNQAYKKSLEDSELPIAISFLMGKGNLLNAFIPTIDGVTDETVTLVLKPIKTSRHYKQLKLVVNRSSFMVKQTTILDPANNTNTVTFSNLVVDVPLPVSGFEFTPPKGVNIL